jgi:nicotinate-nucleotide adenylyltransferase
LPNARSPLKSDTLANNEQRLAMLELALAPWPHFHLSRWEITRPPPSYMHTSLCHFRKQQGTAPLILILGTDSLAQLHLWHQWQDFPRLCHLLVLPRPGSEPANKQVLKAFPEADASTLLAQPAGYRLMLDAQHIDLSSTQIREQLAQGIMPDALAPAVIDYIHTHNLYQS